LDRRSVCLIGLIRLCKRKEEDLEEGRGDVLLPLYCIPAERFSRVYVIECFLMGEKRAILYMDRKDRFS
jgi:hypothetical protein